VERQRARRHRGRSRSLGRRDASHRLAVQLVGDDLRPTLDVATARVRIFTPSFEMPFAGHPTLGTAHVVSELRSAPDGVALEMKAGVIPVEREGDTWTLTARAPTWREAGATHAEIAEMLGLGERDIAGPVMWVDTGSEQLVVPLASSEAVARCQPNPLLLARHGSTATRQGLAYVWARKDGAQVVARASSS
jgi:trans-2,3-dihydro-3-hydroxyanthranilate isomerase